MMDISVLRNKDISVKKNGQACEIKITTANGEEINLILDLEGAEALYEGIETALWDETERSTYLRERVDELEYKLEDAEYQLEYLEESLCECGRW